MPTYEGFRLKLLKYRRKLFANNRNKLLKNKNFTIISNNCWGGMIYESYNLQKQSPTIGLYFHAKDYIKFISNLKQYISKEIVFINYEESVRKEWLIKNDCKVGKYPIGRIDDIEIYFLHYHSEQEVIEKWKRRCERINWERIIYKFNDQNECTENEVKAFFDLQVKNKIFFSCNKKWVNKYGGIYIRQPFNREYIKASYEPFGINRYINLNKYINKL